MLQSSIHISQIMSVSIASDKDAIIHTIARQYRTKDVSIVGNNIFIDFGELCDMMINMNTYAIYLTYSSLGMNDVFTQEELTDIKILNQKKTIVDKILFVLDILFDRIKARHATILTKIADFESELAKYKNKSSDGYKKIVSQLNSEKIKSQKDDIFLKNVEKY